MDAPFIGNLLAFILFLILIYITLYALYLKLNPPRPIPASQQNTQPIFSKPKTALPVVQNDSLPSIFQNDASELLDISIVMVLEPRFNPYHSCQIYKDVYSIFNDILNYFQNKNTSYEVLIIAKNDNLNKDNSSASSNISDINYQDIREFAFQNPEFKILNVTTNAFNRAWQLASIHTRGRLIFNFSPYEDIPFDIISKYIHKIQSGRRRGNEVLVLGSWKPRTNDEIFQTNLSLFSDYIINYLISFLDIKPSAYHHCFSFMMTREAAILILSNLMQFNSFFFSETLIIADSLKIIIKVLKLDQTDDALIERPSINKLDEILTFSLSLFMYKTNYWKITRRPIR